MIGRISVNRNGDLIIRIPAEELRLDEPVPRNVEGVGLLVRRPKLHVVIPLLDSFAGLKQIGPLAPLEEGFFGFPADILSGPDQLFNLLSSPTTLIKLIEKDIATAHSFADHIMKSTRPLLFARNLDSALDHVSAGRARYKRYRFVSVNDRNALLAETLINNVKVHILIGDKDVPYIYAGVAKRNKKTVSFVLIAKFEDINACEKYFEEKYGYDKLELKKYNADTFVHSVNRLLGD